ncbi:enoyl-CoA hydratase-related protein [Amycolatopsis pithecellobii]|uniref:Enoyl-CoA hydratase n=1 Tax=Amycolatopsis pithecellobii TaxID=664692 RepID=A0A6N7ZB45_9PSEU|nr:enoyl-CoA hydratase-related protein [Amycolatopsis pithecellobii]MTD58947.1 enoyl-CoA hydratase [Amycolatopsis pithecellobii]
MTEFQDTYGPREFLELDRPRDAILRVTLNRPEKRNAMSSELRRELFDVLEQADADSDIRVIILRGAGKCFSSGYDLTQGAAGDGSDRPRPYYTAPGIGYWARHVVEGCFRLWDLATPLIAQVDGYCLAGGTELAASCDLVYVADDAEIGYPPVRLMSPPDNQIFPWLMGMRQAMEMMLTGDPISGRQAAELGFANRSFPIGELEGAVLDMAERVAKVPAPLQQMNKRALHRQMEAMGIRNGLRAGTEVQAQAWFTPEVIAYVAQLRTSITSALDQRDGQFGDYRTTGRA